MRALGLRAEDLLLARWNTGGVPAVAGSDLAPILTLGDAPQPRRGSGAAAGGCRSDRRRRDAPVQQPACARGRRPRMLLGFMGPLTAAVAFVAGSAAAYLGSGIDGPVVGTALVFFYASLVVAPRLLVDPDAADGCLAWPMRFALYLASAPLGIGWLTAVTA